MLYELRGVTIDLARVVTVGAIEDRQRLVHEGRTFEVCMTGVRTHLLFKAADRSPAQAMRLETDREALIANWRRFRNARTGCGDAIYRLGDLDINLLAVSAVSCIERRQYGLGAGGTANREDCFEVFIIGVERAVIRWANVEGNGPVEKLREERQALITAWSAVHHKGAA
jgi:hypothetical protein